MYQSPYEGTLVSSQTAGASFVTAFPMLNHTASGIHVVYGGMDTETGTISVRVSNDPVARTSVANAKWSLLTPTVTTLVSSCDNKFFNVTKVRAAHMQVLYTANSNTTGSIAVYVVK